ncbi:hypothetical protein TNIN_288981 [Trichonephila inaurata madagascariensis]|uniref:Uncharacterized protein n=1 Tax=Trichonephila inaurata madagascariensis TaxID=2747483 RepID=A0A8X6YKT3_9ARAC|nr:hypothetical protein TNIN_288981 [Trichonephila inaurata madagascariensis]
MESDSFQLLCDIEPVSMDNVLLLYKAKIQPIQLYPKTSISGWIFRLGPKLTDVKSGLGRPYLEEETISRTAEKFSFRSGFKGPRRESSQPGGQHVLLDKANNCPKQSLDDL